MKLRKPITYNVWKIWGTSAFPFITQVTARIPATDLITVRPMDPPTMGLFLDNTTRMMWNGTDIMAKIEELEQRIIELENLLNGN